MNVAVISGRLTDAPQVRYNTEGKARASYTLAVGYSANETSFIKCAAYDKQAEFAEKYFKKGSRVEVQGRIHTGSYDDANGKKVYFTEITVSKQDFAETKAEAAARENTNGFLDADDADELPFK